MTDNSYTGFGSQIVFKPKHLLLSSNDKNINDSVAQCRNLRLQLRYFTVQAHPESSVSNVNATLRDYANNNNSVDVDNIADKRVLLIKTESCESFHSCHSFISKEKVLKSNQDSGKKNGHQYSIDKSSEEFIDQITVINAIFLDKNTYKNVDNSSEDTYQIKYENSLHGRNQKAPDFSINNGSSSINHDQCSGDRGSTNSSKNFKHSPTQNNIEKVVIPCCGKEKHQEHSGKTKLFNEKLCTSNYVLKTFRINRKISFGTRKPVISKLISRRQAHQAITHKIQPLKRHKEKCSGADIQTDETPKVDEELYKGTLCLWKQGINEGYEMHFLEPIQVMNQSIAFYSQNLKKTSNTDGLLCEREGRFQNLECTIDNSYDDFEESFMKLFNKPQNSYTSVQLSNEKNEIENSKDIAKESLQGEVNENSNSKGNIRFKLTKDQSSYSRKSLQQGDLTVLYKSEAKISDLSLKETFFEMVLGNEDCTEKTDIKYLKEETTEEYEIIDKSNIVEHSGNEMKNNTEEDKKTEHFPKTISKDRTDSVKHRSSSNRKSILPVIEESLEETSKADISDTDYCLVDTLGRPIHLFDHRGLPLTDGSGRPLRSAVGELLMKCDNYGIPVVDEEAQIFDMFGRQPYEEGFQPWMSPQINGASRLTSDDGRPLVLFDLQGRPLTSISGTLLVDSSGRSLLNLKNCFIPSTVRD